VPWFPHSLRAVCVYEIYTILRISLDEYNVKLCLNIDRTILE